MLRQNFSMAYGTAPETVRILGCIELPGMTKQFKEGLKRRDKKLQRLSPMRLYAWAGEQGMNKARNFQDQWQ